MKAGRKLPAIAYLGALCPPYEEAWIAIGLVVLFLAGSAPAHDSSVTWIDARIEIPRLIVTLNLNQSDLFEHVLKSLPGHARFTDRRELEDAAPVALAYVVENLHISVDGKSLGPPTAQDWPPQHAELTHPDANGLETPSVIPLKLLYILPADARHIVIRPDLFNAANFAAIFDVTIITRGMTKPSTTIVERNQPASFEVGKPEKALEPQSEPTSRRHRFGFLATINVILAAAVVTLWWWRRTRRSRYIL